ncbi:hypothetical protein [Micromonospora sp. B9E7]
MGGLLVRDGWGAGFRADAVLVGATATAVGRGIGTGSLVPAFVAVMRCT